ncbi:hypothetical protein ACFVH9_08630 [Streptomyces hirsutus]|uniref:hypothetical protein n=1 Tax=Streptomyces hirsutus TaxID=35620 RepID=UPI0036396D52
MTLHVVLLEVGLAVDEVLAGRGEWGPPLAVFATAAAVVAARTDAVRTHVRTAVRTVSALRTAWPCMWPLTCPDTSADGRPDVSGRDFEGGS